MRVECIALSGVGRFRDSVSVGPLAPGLNVLAAPNEAGKSTLVRALARCLFDKYNGRGEEIRLLQPAGSSLAPTITVVLQTSSERYRITKRFLEKPASTLFREEHGKWQRIAESDKADESLRNLLASSLPGSGASRPEHWGLQAYLWARQGEPAVWPEWPGIHGEQVRARLASVELDPLIEELIGKFEAEAATLLTSTGRPKTGGEIERLEAEIAEITASLADLRERRSQLESLQERQRAAAEQRLSTTRLLTEKTREATDLTARATAASQLAPEITRLDDLVRTASERLESVSGDQTRLASFEKEERDLAATVLRLEKDLPTIERNLAVNTTRLRETRENLDALPARRAELETQRQRVNARSERDATERAIRELEQKLTRINSASNELAELRRRLAALPNFYADTFTRLRALDEAVRLDTARLEAAGLTVVATPLALSSVIFHSGGKSDELTASSDQPARHQSASRVRIDLAGWGSLEISSGSREAVEIAARRERDVRELRAGLERVGVADANALEIAHAAATSLTQEIQHAETRYEALIGVGESLESVRDSLTAQTARLDQLRAAAPPDADPRDSPADSAEVTTRLAALDAEERSLRKQEAGFRAELESHTNAEVRIRMELARLAQLQIFAASQQRELIARYPVGIAAALKAAQSDFVRAEARAAEARSRLPSDHDSLPTTAARARKAVDELSAQAHSLDRECHGLETQLRDRGAEGLYSRETEILEQLEVLTGQLNASRRRAHALRLLTALLRRRKQLANRKVLDPLEIRLTAAFAELTGVAGRRVFLNEDLAITGVGRSPEERFPFASLSQGAREQLLLALRAAIAREVAVGGEPHLLILDDVLVNTDPARQQRVLTFLESLAATVQILVLTCHPDRYAGAGTRVEFLTDDSAVVGAGFAP